MYMALPSRHTKSNSLLISLVNGNTYIFGITIDNIVFNCLLLWYKYLLQQAVPKLPFFCQKYNNRAFSFKLLKWILKENTQIRIGNILVSNVFFFRKRKIQNVRCFVEQKNEIKSPWFLNILWRFCHPLITARIR